MKVDSPDCTALAVIPGEEKKETDDSVLEIPHFVQLTRRYLALVWFSCEAFSELQRGVLLSRNRLRNATYAVSVDQSGTSHTVSRALTQLIRSIDDLVALNATTLKLLRPEVPSPAEDSQVDPDLPLRFKDMPLLQVAALKLDFLRLAHDLNNMLTVAKGNAQLASLRSGDGDKVRSLLKEVEGALTRMEVSLSEQMSALNENELEGQRVPELSAVFGDLVSQMQAHQETVIVEMEATVVQYSAELGLSSAQLKSLLFCLCDNAKKAGATQVCVKVRRDGSNLVIELKDNGPGFEGLDPLDASRKSQKRSSLNGNGIPLCTRFCRQAGGSLTLVNPNAAGAEWRIVLPLRAASPR